MSLKGTVVGLFFILLLLAGIFIFKDYGISWDEPVHLERGHGFLDYIFRGDRRLIMDGNFERSYGAFPDVILAAVERGFRLQRGSRALFLVRHFILFLIYCLGVGFFFLLGRKIFASWELGLLGSLMLVLSPRIFAHAFYNPKDIPLMSAMIVAFYTLVRFLERPAGGRLAWHALACALATDVRMTGMLTFFLTGAAFLFLLWESRKVGKKVLLVFKQALLFVFLYVFLTVLLWPTLWENPISRFVSALRFSTSVPWRGSLLYLGKFFNYGYVPWHYIPVWIAISTPLLYLGLFLIGTCALVSDFFKKRSVSGLRRTWGFLVLLWFFIPPLASILYGVRTFDEWRHLFFIYPALLLISLKGFSAAYEAVKKAKWARSPLTAKLVLTAVVLVGLAPVGFFMVKYHPHQNVYFNRLAGRDMASVAQKFELDYWGLSYKQGLEYLLRFDPSEEIKVAVDNRPGELNVLILPRDQRRRLIIVQPLLMKIVLNRKIIQFAERRAGRYFVNIGYSRLVLRTKMTPSEKAELLRIFWSPREREAIEQLYLDSQKLETAKYFLTNYRLHPGEFPFEKIHSVKVGNASILGIYRLGDVFPDAAQAY